MNDLSGQVISLPEAPGKRIPKKQLINLINALHYSQQPLLITFFKPSQDFYLTVRALPGPTAHETTEFHWVKDRNFPPSLSSFEIQKITITIGQTTCLFTPERYRITDQGVELLLPDFAHVNGARQNRRFTCQTGLSATLTQNAITFAGCLMDYSPQGMVFELFPDTQWSPSLLNHASDATLIVNKNHQTIYFGTVHLAKKASESHLLLRPDNEKAPRYAKKINRARRQMITPGPELHFNHPITGMECALKIGNIGSLGFCVLEKKDHQTLLPGLIIRHVRVYLASSMLFSCEAQVVYCSADLVDPGYVRCGLTILAIEPADHLKLIHLVQHAEDDKSYINNLMDPEDLFRFFFETGFIYPEKYSEISSYKEEYTSTYKTLYQQSTNISRHFTYQSPGRIHGHFATLMIYRKTWINQHHAALQNNRAGLKVVRAISEFINDSYPLDSNNIRYIIGYYRPNNKFPRHYFGEFVHKVNNKEITSIDELAYFQDASSFQSDIPLGELWALSSATAVDILQFGAFYKQHSGGLLPKVLDLTSENYANRDVADLYSKNGLYRTRQIFALRYRGELSALVDLQQSSRGLNLSEITNAITFYFLVCPDRTSTHAAVKAVTTLMANNFRKQQHPIMIYPAETATFLGFTAQKTYNLWALDIIPGADAYMDWMNKFCR